MPLAEIEKNLEHWVHEVFAVTSFLELEKLKAELLGRAGVVTSAFKLMKDASAIEKKSMGERLNKVKSELENAFSLQRKKLEDYEITERLKGETLDVTLPVSCDRFGGLHIISYAMRRIRNHYLARGFRVSDGPEIETEFFNFDALNTPRHHPARQSQDTFYIEGTNGVLLRTQTSSVQIRTLQKHGIPVRMISIGKTYRNDALDATHSPMFHQVECLIADRSPISLGHLKSELRKFLQFFFETDDVSMRFRSSFFPFTEPSVEVDCRCMKKNGQLIITEKGDKWLELGGAGMVHPNVFRNSGITGDAYGFAFGFGLERLVMLKNGITDIRNLFDTDQRWLQHYEC